MSRARIGKHHAAFPPGYKIRNPVLLTAWHIARRSRRTRAFMFKLPPSRFRMFFLGHYYWRTADAFNREEIRAIIRQTVSPDAELELFALGRFKGPDGWHTAFTDWRESFDAQQWKAGEVINPPGSDKVVIAGRAAGRGARSAVSLALQAALLITVRDGMAVHGRFCEKTEALEAAGLRE